MADISLESAELLSLNYVHTLVGVSASWETLKAYVGAPSADDLFVQDCWLQAYSLVQGFIGTASAPVEILVRAIIEVGSELYHRRNAPNGIAQFATVDGSAIRVARDPMIGAYPILARFIGPGLA